MATAVICGKCEKLLHEDARLEVDQLVLAAIFQASVGETILVV
jgi:hypothetical protein